MMLDTNAISALAARDTALLNVLRPCRSLALPFIALAEYRFGIAKSRHREILTQWLTILEQEHSVLFADRNTLDHYAAVRGELSEQGTPIPAHDIWIAALCRQHSKNIVSRDKHFDHIVGLRRIEW
jgi:tRNA(fMet)-specific endonuclease VapC